MLPLICWIVSFYAEISQEEYRKIGGNRILITTFYGERSEYVSKIIFIAGIHGVGKTYLCNQITSKFSFKTYSASKLIEELKEEKFKDNKKIKDINNNQEILLEAIDQICKKEEIFILDGHFCLLNNKGEITRISEETFFKISPNAILILHDTTDNIIERLKNRDNAVYDVNLIESFQKEELKYSLETVIFQTSFAESQY